MRYAAVNKKKPDARAGNSAKTKNQARIAMAKLRIGVLYDYWWDEDEERVEGERPKKKSPDDDVQAVYANFDIPDDVLQAVVA